MPFDTKACSAGYTFEQPVQATFGELDHLIARRADQVMAVCGLRQSVAMTAVVPVHPAHDACFDQDVQRAIHRDQPQVRVTATRALMDFRRRKRLVHPRDHIEHGAAWSRELVSPRVERLMALIGVETRGYSS